MSRERAELEKIKTDALAESDLILTEAREAAEQLLAEAQSAAKMVQLKAQAQAKSTREEGLEQLRSESEHLQNEIRQRLEGLQGEVSELDFVHQSLKEECESLTERSNALRSDTERLGIERSTREAAIVELRRVGESTKRLNREAQVRYETEREQSRLELENENNNVRLAMEREHAQLLAGQKEERSRKESETESARAELQAVQAEVKAVLHEASEVQKAHQLEMQVAEAENRRHRAILSAEEAEFRSKQVALETAIGEIGLKRIEAEREYQLVLSRRQEQQEGIRLDREQANRTLASQREESELNLATAREQSERMLAAAFEQSERTHAVSQAESRVLVEKNLVMANETQHAEAAFLALRKSTLEVESNLAALREKCALAKTEHDTELARLERQRKLTNDSKAQFDAELRAMQARNASELAALKTEGQQELRASLQAEFAAKAKVMETEISQAKLREMERIEGLLAEERASDRGRRQYMLGEITERALELAAEGDLASSERELRAAIQDIFDGKTAAATSAQASARTRRFWKRTLGRVAVPTAALLLYAIFPDAPGRFKDRLSRGLASHQREDSGVFLEQIRQKSLKYQPETDQVFRDSYRDNLLYLAGYGEMKFDEKEQRAWTLELNRFLVGDLGLNDQVVVDFVASESVLVKELFRVREGLLPQYLDQGLERMAETEKTESERMLKILKTLENYRKFRELERKNYERFVARRQSGA